jgi:4-hydroxybenzoate polyprenyltransferase
MLEKRQNGASGVKSNGEAAEIFQQYGGGHTGTWVNGLNQSWIPYVKLARLSPPIAVLLIYIPHLFGVFHAAIVYQQPPLYILEVSLKLLGGSLFFSNAAHAWNDLIDAPIDRQVSRTENRPIARGDITPMAGLLFTMVQGLLAASFLLCLSPRTAKATIPTIVGTLYYPWAKRHTHFPQLVLGFCLAWGIVVGSAAAGVKQPWEDLGILNLVIVSSSWTVIFDTIYAHQDLDDDIRLGIGSTAVFFGHHAKAFLWTVLVFMGAAIVAYGKYAALGAGFHIIALTGCQLSLGIMIARVNLRDKASCWWWFAKNFWFTAASILGGQLFEYLCRIVHYQTG